MRFTYSSENHDGWTHGLQHEWLETNGLGGYASSTVVGCNTRKYHGLYVVNLPDQADRHVLLSTLEETVTCHGASLPLSSRQHPDVYYPKGHEYITEVTTSPFIETTYTFDSLVVSRAMLWLNKTNTLLIRYIFHKAPQPTHFSLRPLLAYRSFHTLTHENSSLNSHVSRLNAGEGNGLGQVESGLSKEIGKERIYETGKATHSETGGRNAPQSNNNVNCQPSGGVQNGIALQPYPSLPPLVVQTSASHSVFIAQADWCRNVLYAQEAERGFPSSEDLFMPGQFVFSHVQDCLYLAIGLEPFFHNNVQSGTSSLQFAQQAWDNEVNRRKTLNRPYPTQTQRTLAKTAESFIVHQPRVGTSILAGYHWFNAWGRDSFIALPGLCFCTGQHELGQKILAQTCPHAKNGLVPNILSPDGDHAYNSADASLWYLWAVQQMTRYVPECLPFIKETLWSFLKEIIQAYAQNTQGDFSFTSTAGRTHGEGGAPFTSVDGQGFLKVGTPETQLTWMDSMAYGKAVTPRNGYPIEMNALWYSALVFVNELAEKFEEPPFFCPATLEAMPQTFMQRFWVESPQQLAGDPNAPSSNESLGVSSDGYLADVWEETQTSLHIRPNQIFAIAMPHSLVKERHKAQAVVRTVTNHLLTPYGLRTLSPVDKAYCPRYEGGPDERDFAYHQGTVWPWLLGAYAESLMKTSDNKEQDASNLLTTIAPLFHTHINEAGLGSISEIFDGSAPHRPNGCISQAWSVAELLRLTETINHFCPGLLEHHVDDQGRKKS